MTRAVRKLDAPTDNLGRVETGAVQFGDDWSGLFIRGDDCARVYCGLSVLENALDRFNPSEWMMIRQALSILDCIPKDVHGMEVK